MNVCIHLKSNIYSIIEKIFDIDKLKQYLIYFVYMMGKEDELKLIYDSMNTEVHCDLKDR